MIKTKVIAMGPWHIDKWNINKPFFLVPKIDKEYLYGGVRMYKCGKRKFFADIYDRMFKTTFSA